MTRAESLAAFVDRVKFEDLSDAAVYRLKHNILDTIGCALAAFSGKPIDAVREQVSEFETHGPCTLIGGATGAPHMAAFHNGALVRYVDFMDNYIAKKQSGHPSDTFAAVLAASEYRNRSGKEFLTSLALAYGVFSFLLEHFPVQEKGYDHTVQLAIADACGCSKSLGLTTAQCANAIAITATSVQGLVEVRSDYLSQWKGLASAFTAMDAVFATFLALRGITGPSEVFEGVRGLEAVIGENLEVAWDKCDLNHITRTSLKTYNAEVHSQSAIEGMLELASEYNLKAEDIDKIDINIFRQADTIIGHGSQAGHKKKVFSKEQADHSIFYLLAVAILDREVTPRQFTEERIMRRDVQELLQKVEAENKIRLGIFDAYTNAYPDELRCKITVSLKNGKTVSCEKKDYYGFFSRPMSWEDVVSKFEALASPYADRDLRSNITETVFNLDKKNTKDLTGLLAQVKPPPLRTHNS
jgi:2-methylcitrate dehydratase